VFVRDRSDHKVYWQTNYWRK